MMHFALDVVSFLVCHFEVSRLSEAGQRQLMLSSSPIAEALRSQYRGVMRRAQAKAAAVATAKPTL